MNALSLKEYKFTHETYFANLDTSLSKPSNILNLLLQTLSWRIFL